MISFLIYWLLAERFSSGKRFRQDFYPHSAISSFSCFKNTFLGTFSSGQIGTFSSPWENGLHFGTFSSPWENGLHFGTFSSLFSLGEWFTFWNFSSPWENGLHFGTSLFPGRMVYILELLFSLGEKSFTRRIWRDFPKFFILSSLIKTLFSLGEWFTFWNLLFSLGEWFSFSTRINLSSQIGGVSLEIYVWGYVKKATQKQRFDIDFVPVFLNFGQVLFSIK